MILTRFRSADKEGELWLGTNLGLNKFNPVTKQVMAFEPDPENTHSLTGKNVKCAYIDKQGIYWFGTFRGGINKYDQNLNLFALAQSNPFDEKALPGNTKYFIITDTRLFFTEQQLSVSA